MSDAEASVPLSTGRQWRNPIFNRELLTLLRSKRAFAFMGIYLVISAGIVLSSWPREASSLLLQGQISRELFYLFALGQTLLLALLVPAILGSSMTTEKEGGTIDLLLTTPVSSDQIVIGKLLSGLSYFVLLAVVSIPILLLCFVIGGLSAEDVLGLYLFFFIQALLYGLISLNCSIYFHRTNTAVILAYVFVGVLAVILSAIYGDGIAFLSSARYLGILLWAVPLAIGLYISARQGSRIPYNPVRKSIEEEDPEQIVGLVLRRDVFPDKLIVPPRNEAPMEDGANPVLYKELQAGIYGTGSLFARLVIQFSMFLSVGAFIWTISNAVNYDAYYGGQVLHPEYPYFCFIIAFLMVVAPALASRMFTHEKEEQTADSLVLTLLPRRDIVMGKFLAVVRVVTVLAALNTFLFVVIVLFSAHRHLQLAAMAFTILVVAALTTSVGMYFSLICRTTLAAMIGTYCALFLLYICPILASTFLTRLFTGISTHAFAFLNMVSPFLAVRMPVGGQQHQLAQLFVHGLGSGLLCLLLLWVMSRRMEKTLQKQSQML